MDTKLPPGSPHKSTSFSRILVQVGGIVVGALILWLVGLEPFGSGAPQPQAPMPGTSAPTVALTSTAVVSAPLSSTPIAAIPLLSEPSVVMPVRQRETGAPADDSVAELTGETLGLSPEPAQEVSIRAPQQVVSTTLDGTPVAREEPSLSPDPCADSASDVASACVDDQAAEGAMAHVPGESGGEAPPRDVSVGGAAGVLALLDSPLVQPGGDAGSAGEASEVITPFDSPLVQPRGDTETVATPAPEGDWVWPVRGTISQGYSSAHRAIDLDAVQGSVVRAADAGRVVYARWESSGYGYLVIVDHGHGKVSYYAHLYGFYVDVGQTLTRGQQIGELGNTGDSTGPHLHFEIRYDGVQLDPLDLLPES